MNASAAALASKRKELKTIQILTLAWAGRHGRPMAMFEQAGDLLKAIPLPPGSVPVKHWSSSSGRSILASMDAVLKQKISSAVLEAGFYALSIDDWSSHRREFLGIELSILDKTTWRKKHLFLALKRGERAPLLHGRRCS